MRTVREVSELTGVSIRALHHYDAIGLLRPTARTDAGYRLYSEEDLARLQHILLFRELEFPLKDIKGIIDSPTYDQSKALQQHIELLELKRDHIDQLISLAKNMKTEEVSALTFEAFDTSKIEEYTQAAKASWGSSAEWKEFEQKSAGRPAATERALGSELMELFIPFGQLAATGASPSCEEAQRHAHRIQDFITEHYYTCSNEVFRQLGTAYGCGGDFTRNINAIAGPGAAEFAAEAIEVYTS